VIIVTSYGAGGFDPNRPKDNAATWFDTATRTAYAADDAGTVTSRPFNPSENSVADSLERPGRRDANAVMLEAQARTSYQNNLDFLALPAPTFPLNVAAQSALVAQVAALTRQTNALIRLAVADLLDP
jgi:hypothetical protein